MAATKQLALIVAGLGYGDEGKGSCVDWLVRQYQSDLVVRYNGGAQAAHHVVLPDGRMHCFAQFGSGTFAGARTHLSKHMLVNPVSLMNEARHLEELGVDPWPLLTIDENAIVTTPLHVAANRLKEMHRNRGRHGSCGMGIGETVRDHEENDFRIRVKDLFDEVGLHDLMRESMNRLKVELKDIGRDLEARMNGDDDPAWEALDHEWSYFDKKGSIRTLFAEKRMVAFLEKIQRSQIVSSDWLATELEKDQPVVFEGAQGMLLDQKYGFFPYVTRTDLTFANAFDLLPDDYPMTQRIGILRSFQTRHGAGPFVTEDEDFDEYAADDHNQNNQWQQGFKSGPLDLVATKYAIEAIGGIDSLIMTHVDKLEPFVSFPVCVGYKMVATDELRAAVNDLPVDHDTTLKKQAEMTTMLSYCKPRIGEVRARDFPQQIARMLGVHLMAISKGQTHEDKVAL